MGARRILRGDQWIATVIEDPADGGDPYLVPPVVFGADGTVVMGADVLTAMVNSGVVVDHPMLRDIPPAELAEIDRFLAAVCDQLGIGMD